MHLGQNRVVESVLITVSRRSIPNLQLCHIKLGHRLSFMETCNRVLLYSVSVMEFMSGTDSIKLVDAELLFQLLLICVCKWYGWFRLASRRNGGYENVTLSVAMSE